MDTAESKCFNLMWDLSEFLVSLRSDASLNIGFKNGNWSGTVTSKEGHQYGVYGYGSFKNMLQALNAQRGK